MKPRRGKKDSASSSAPVSASGHHTPRKFLGACEDVGGCCGGNGGLPSQTLSTVGHGGTHGYTRALAPTHALTRDFSNPERSCNVLQDSDFPTLSFQRPKSRKLIMRDRREERERSETHCSETCCVSIDELTQMTYASVGTD